MQFSIIYVIKIRHYTNINKIVSLVRLTAKDGAENTVPHLVSASKIDRGYMYVQQTYAYFVALYISEYLEIGL